MKRFTIIFLIVASILLADQNSTTAKLDAKVIYIQYGCTGCHGFYAQGTNIGPKLQGQNEEMLIRRLQDLQNGITRTPNGTVMISFAKTLDTDQIKALAKYLHSIKTSYENRKRYDYDSDAAGDS